VSKVADQCVAVDETGFSRLEHSKKNPTRLRRPLLRGLRCAVNKCKDSDRFCWVHYAKDRRNGAGS
jgi:hypothetical protein